ncbi:phenylacetate-CoA oxygenase subunit PaaJ [Microbacterium bovistercoris]|uniref:Phenylacetate-CoA oxygenase subunit PaaJ n=1 Tax=Microbacterium bovistercoris TaxID=2293570 RepID=A0A371NUQ7_9MICO|nr:1,2-phenylacetyl-CoA epoxidase subunit PaaD [Microbacterium bovistercoris]REJ06132.1 phenylacetate-CoA oxygenase subunit PaaJ [Microbacterium bovistercoris]
MSAVLNGTDLLARAWEAASRVVDPELPMLTLVDLGVLRYITVDDDGTVVAALTPTYSGCPAMATMRDDLQRELQETGFSDVRIRIALDPAWTTDWITPHGREALAAAGISPPGVVPAHSGPIPIRLGPTQRAVHCPQCGSADVVLASEFGSTACKAMYRCRSCLEPFDHVKEI